MRHKRLLCCLLGGLLPAVALRADGLIQNVSNDGAAAVYDLKQEGEVIGSGETIPLSATGTARIALVGAQTVAGLKCRWVELVVEQEASLGNEQHSQLIYYKLLVPENDLNESGDPLASAIKIFSMRSPADDAPRLITGNEDRRLALWFLRDFFPPSPTKQNRLNEIQLSHKIETPAGVFDSRVHAFDSFVDQYLLGPSRTQDCRIYRIWKNSASPFGVVAMNVHYESQQVSIPATRFAGASDKMSRVSLSMVTELRLRSVEDNVASRFPKLK